MQTRCTIPAATVDTSIQTITSGSFAWKSRPNNTDSKLETAVKLKIKSQDAIKPPRIVADCVEDSRGLYICSTENKSTETKLDKTRDTDVGTAAKCKEINTISRNPTRFTAYPCF